MNSSNSSGKSTWKLPFAPHIGFPSIHQPLFLHMVGSEDPVDQIRFLAERGFAGIEDNFLKNRTAEDQARIGEALAKYGLRMGCFLNSNETGRHPLLGSKESEAKSHLKKELQQSFEAAKRTGGKHLTTVGGRNLRVPIGFDLFGATENLKWMAEMAEKAGVVLCMEQTAEARLPGMIFHDLAEVYRIVKSVDSPAVRIVYDFAPAQMMGGNILDNMETIWDLVEVVQVGDVPGRLEPGSGELNFVNLFRAVIAKGYTGLVELEHTCSKPGIEGEQLALDRLKAINEAI